MKKICFYTGSLKQGGAERDIAVFANHLVNLGYEVSIVLVFSSDIFFELDKRIKVIDFSKDITSRSFRKIKLLRRKIVDLQEKNKNDFYICNMIGLNFTLVSTLGKRRDCKVICRIVSDLLSWPIYKRMLAKYYYPKCYKVIAQTKYQSKSLGKKVLQNTQIIPNICEFDLKIDPAKNFEFRQISYVGRLNVPVKRIDILIEAFSKFLSVNKDFELHLYGEYPDDNGESERIIFEKINDKQLSKSVHVHGKIKNVFEVLEKSFCFLFSSPSEGMPNSLIEPYIIGLPIVSSNFRGSECMFENGEDALIYKFGDIDSLVECLNNLTNNCDLYSKISNKSYSRRNRYSFSETMKLWETVLK